MKVRDNPPSKYENLSKEQLEILQLADKHCIKKNIRRGYTFEEITEDESNWYVWYLLRNSTVLPNDILIIVCKKTKECTWNPSE